MRDIHVLVDEKYMLEYERIEVLQRWRKKFAKDSLLVKMLTEIAKEHFEKKQ